MTKILLKIRERYALIKKNGLTKDRPVKGLWRYIKLNVLFSLGKSVNHSWIGDLKLNISKGDAGIVGNVYYGLYEYKESLFLLHFLREEDQFVDVGANLGHFSLLVAGILGCRVSSVEAISKTSNRFKKLVTLNSLEHLIEVHNCGVSSKAGYLHFSTNSDVMNSVVDKEYPYAIKVPVLTIDTITSGKKVTCLKIDIEGYEFEALKGSTAILNDKTLKVVIVELNNSGLKYDTQDSQVAQFLMQQGFLAYDYNPFERLLFPLKTFNKSQFNTIFIRDLDFVKTRIKLAPKISVLHHSI